MRKLFRRGLLKQQDGAHSSFGKHARQISRSGIVIGNSCECESHYLCEPSPQFGYLFRGKRLSTITKNEVESGSFFYLFGQRRRFR